MEEIWVMGERPAGTTENGPEKEAFGNEPTRKLEDPSIFFVNVLFGIIRVSVSIIDLLYTNLIVGQEYGNTPF
jgi:hypothetical protein